MEHKAQKFQKYFKETIDVEVAPKAWKREETLPFFLRGPYNFYQISVLDQPCMLVVAKDDEDVPPGRLGKHLRAVRERWDGVCIYGSTNVSSYNRKRLVEHHIPFVVPGRHLYLPNLGIDFREHFEKTHHEKKPLSPATQAVLLYVLYHSEIVQFLPSELAVKLGYTRMTMTRAFDELEALELGKITEHGKERHLRFEQREKALWELLAPHLQTPVKKRVWVKLKKKSGLPVKAGFTALDEFSMLEGPECPVYALNAKSWEAFRKTHVQEELPFKNEREVEDADAEIEVWSYDPNLFAKDGFVDPLSLYVSLRGIDDPRVEIALEELMEKASWCKD